METGPSQRVGVEVDAGVCAASGICKRIAPEVFALADDSAFAVALEPTLSDPALIALAEEAAEACPTVAILLTRD